MATMASSLKNAGKVVCIGRNYASVHPSSRSMTVVRFELSGVIPPSCAPRFGTAADTRLQLATILPSSTAPGPSSRSFSRSPLRPSCSLVRARSSGRGVSTCTTRSSLPSSWASG